MGSNDIAGIGAAVAAVYLVVRALRGDRVPLAVWLIPPVLLLAYCGLVTSVGVERILGHVEISAGSSQLERIAAQLAERVDVATRLCQNVAGLAIVQAGFAGFGGPERDDRRPIWRSETLILGCASGAVHYVGFRVIGAAVGVRGASWTALPSWLSSVAVVAVGIGAAACANRKVPSSYAAVPATLGVVGLGALVLSVWLLHVQQVIGGIAPSSPIAEGLARLSRLHLTYVGASIVAAVAASGLGWLARRKNESPWKTGTIGDGVLFGLVVIVGSAGVGATVHSSSSALERVREAGARGAAASFDGRRRKYRRVAPDREVAAGENERGRRTELGNPYSEVRAQGDDALLVNRYRAMVVGVGTVGLLGPAIRRREVRLESQ